MVNARHLFYSISMIDRYKDSGKFKPYLIFALTDETYSLLSDGTVPAGIEERKDINLYRFLVSFFNQCYWVTGSVLGRVLPAALIGMLVIYCLKDVSVLTAPHGLPELIAALSVVGLQIWKRNSLISILTGTVVYMLLMQLVF